MGLDPSIVSAPFSFSPLYQHCPSSILTELVPQPPKPKTQKEMTATTFGASSGERRGLAASRNASSSQFTSDFDDDDDDDDIIIEPPLPDEVQKSRRIDIEVERLALTFSHRTYEMAAKSLRLLETKPPITSPSVDGAADTQNVTSPITGGVSGTTPSGSPPTTGEWKRTGSSNQLHPSMSMASLASSVDGSGFPNKSNSGGGLSASMSFPSLLDAAAMAVLHPKPVPFDSYGEQNMRICVGDMSMLLVNETPHADVPISAFKVNRHLLLCMSPLI
jgi:hypothetical protein